MKLLPICLAMLASTHALSEISERRHLHHQHRRALPKLSTSTVTQSASESASEPTSSQTPSKLSSDSQHSSEMPSDYSSDTELKTLTTSAVHSVTAMPTLSLASSSTSSSSSSTSYTFKASIPTGSNLKNPYFQTSSLPTNTVFIVVAAVLGLLTIAVFVASFVIWMDSRKKAKRDKENQYYNPFQYAQSEKGLFLHSDSSSYSAKSSDMSSNSTTSQGRTYREMSMGIATAGNRNSMTISPVLEMMQSSRSNLELPLFNDTYTHTSSSSPSLLYKGERTSTTDLLNMTEQAKPGKNSRPPSQLLDDLLLGIEFGETYPGEK